VEESDKVLLIMTPNYKNKAEKRIGGVGYEISMITAEIFNKQDTDKFIPILISGSRAESAPSFVKSRIDVDMSNQDEFEKKFEELLRAIYDEPEIKRPSIGQKPTFK
jgi:hypothetical protein